MLGKHYNFMFQASVAIINDKLFITEPYLSGHFQKWNSNFGWLANINNDADQLLHAFSHWTFGATTDYTIGGPWVRGSVGLWVRQVL